MTPKERRAAITERRAKAIAMRLAGATLEHIAKHLGYGSRSHVSKDIDRALEEYREQQTAATRNLISQELARIDRLQAGHWPGATKGDPRAAEIVLKCMTHRAKLLGLEAPTRVETTVTETPEVAAMIAAAQALADEKDPE